MTRRNCCTYPHCEEPKDTERGAQMCADHSLAWMRSDAFRAAAQDPDLRFAMSLSQSLGARELAKRRRQWAKADAAREADGDSDVDGEEAP